MPDAGNVGVRHRMGYMKACDSAFPQCPTSASPTLGIEKGKWQLTNLQPSIINASHSQIVVTVPEEEKENKRIFVGYNFLIYLQADTFRGVTKHLIVCFHTIKCC